MAQLQHIKDNAVQNEGEAVAQLYRFQDRMFQETQSHDGIKACNTDNKGMESL